VQRVDLVHGGDRSGRGGVEQRVWLGSQASPGRIEGAHGHATFDLA
jgi:hypothetical protein